MRPRSVALAVAGSALVLSVSACGGKSEPTAEPNEPRLPTAAETRAAAAPDLEPAADTGPGNGAAAQPFEEFDPDDFVQPTVIDNPWLPMRPGTQYIYEGFTAEGGRDVPHRAVITIADLTKIIAGVRTVVSWDLDYSAGELVEAELAFFAQDSAGNVWRMGEYPKEYERGTFVDAPAWITGLANARAGISVRAEPELGAGSYSQGGPPRSTSPTAGTSIGSVSRPASRSTATRTCS